LFAQRRLEPFQLKFQRKHWEQAIGSSGSLRAIDKVLIAKNWRVKMVLPVKVLSN
jgi:exopolyphosphatase/guanosine-5'-triphosphate,3'-diphosphate pyrophosphatase